MVSIWTALTAIAPVLAPVISLILVLIGRIIWNHEQRIREMEKSQRRHGRTLYGDDADYRQSGLSHDLKDVIERLSRVEQKLDELNGHHDHEDGETWERNEN